MHNPQYDTMVQEMTDEEKLKSVTVDALARDKTLIKQYEYWYLSTNKYPHTDRWEHQYVLWLKWKGRKKYIDYPMKKAWIELYHIMKDITEMIGTHDFYVVRNGERDRSIPNYHIHFYS